jgi:hypothetical protein
VSFDGVSLIRHLRNFPHGDAPLRPLRTRPSSRPPAPHPPSSFAIPHRRRPPLSSVLSTSRVLSSRLSPQPVTPPSNDPERSQRATLPASLRSPSSNATRLLPSRLPHLPFPLASKSLKNQALSSPSGRPQNVQPVRLLRPLRLFPHSSTALTLAQRSSHCPAANGVLFINSRVSPNWRLDYSAGDTLPLPNTVPPYAVARAS